MYMNSEVVKSRRIRSSVGAGMFYPDNKDDILDRFNSFGLKKTGGGRAKAIIVPHGAWEYSGALAARAFSAASGRSENVTKVVILGPIHDKREAGLFLSNSHSFHTPVGDVEVDRKISEALESSSDFLEINDIPHLGEHSIEVILPFVKYCFSKASIAPILMGQPEERYIHDLAKALKTVITPVLDETLIVISCNLSYNSDKTAARSLAEECLKLFSEKNARVLEPAILSGRLDACGGALAVSLFESGLLSGTKARFQADSVVNAVDAENKSVFYCDVAFE